MKDDSKSFPTEGQPSGSHESQYPTLDPVPTLSYAPGPPQSAVARPSVHLVTVNWDELEPIVKSFQSAWLQGQRPEIDHYLPDSSAERRALLFELVQADLE